MSKTLIGVLAAVLKKHGLGGVTPDESLYLKLDNPPYQTLVIERLYTADHGAVVYSVSHTYLQEGDVMHDPEMCFDLDGQPLYYKNDGLGVEQYVFEPSDQRRRYRPRLSTDLRRFAAAWAGNLRQQGYLTERAVVVACSHPALLPDQDRARLAA